MTTNPISITNEHAQIFAACVIFDRDDEQLVAAVIPYAHGGNHAELLKAIKASLTTNSDRWITVRSEDLGTTMLKGAKQGYIVSSAAMRQASAEGRVEVWLHTATGSPQSTDRDYFYLLAYAESNLEQLFVDRLNLAVPWPIKPEWADLIFNAALQAGLITNLPIVGQSRYTIALRIDKNPDKWAVIINQALTDNHIHV